MRGRAGDKVEKGRDGEMGELCSREEEARDR